MAVPFGGHPRLAEYLAWAREQGCDVKCGYQTDELGRAFSLLRIDAPSGRFILLHDMDQRERLVPSSIARLDRRLGLQSPFFSISGDD